MQAITPELEALLKARLQAGGTGFLGRFEVDSVSGGEVSTASFAPRRVSIDKSLQMRADSATVELANEALPLGWGPSGVFPTGSRCRVFQWYGDPASEVCTFSGLIDAATDSRDPLTVSVACRDMMALLLDQSFSATAPQGAGEAGAVRTADNGVYLSMEASAVVEDILDRAGWPPADRAEAFSRGELARVTVARRPSHRDGDGLSLTRLPGRAA